MKNFGGGNDSGSGEAPENGGGNHLLKLLTTLGAGAATGAMKGSQQPQQAGAPVQFNEQGNQLPPDFYSLLQPQQPRLFRQ